MTEEPEQMLEQQRIAAAVGHEEARAEIAVGQQHGDGAGQHRQRQQQQEGGDQHRPGEQRHLVQRHARRAHVEDGGDEVDGAEDRRRAGEVQRQDGEVHGRPALLARAADRSSSRRPAPWRRVWPSTNIEMSSRSEGRRQQPERDVVHAREGHVGRADHQRHEPVAEPADHRRHDHEEDHEQPVGGHEHVVHVLAGIERRLAGLEAIDHGGQTVEDLDAGLLQLHAHDDRQSAADHPRHDGEDQIHRADVLVVGRIDIAPPPGTGGPRARRATACHMSSSVTSLNRAAGAGGGPSFNRLPRRSRLWQAAPPGASAPPPHPPPWPSPPRH